jgi:hypothetical protein
MKYLGSLDEDATFEQEKAQRLSEWTQESAPLVCADLSAATDRLPNLLQGEVLNEILGKGAGDSWIRVMINRKFSPPPGRSDEYPILYGVGTPMGALTSWSVFAITHHLIVREAFHQSGISPRGRYLVLGDDVAFLDLYYGTPRSVWGNYHNIMTQLGVNISKPKSTFPHMGFHSCGEFAKRQFIGGVDLSPIPVNQLRSWRDETGVLSLYRYWMTQLRRGLISFGEFESYLLNLITKRRVLLACYLLTLSLWMKEQDDHSLFEQVIRLFLSLLKKRGVNKPVLRATEQIFWELFLKRLQQVRKRITGKIHSLNYQQVLKLNLAFLLIEKQDRDTWARTLMPTPGHCPNPISEMVRTMIGGRLDDKLLASHPVVDDLLKIVSLPTDLLEEDLIEGCRTLMGSLFEALPEAQVPWKRSQDRGLISVLTIFSRSARKSLEIALENQNEDKGTLNQVELSEISLIFDEGEDGSVSMKPILPFEIPNSDLDSQIKDIPILADQQFPDIFDFMGEMEGSCDSLEFTPESLEKIKFLPPSPKNQK